MVTIRYLLSMLIVLLLSTSCSQEIFEPSIIRGQAQSESFERIKKEFDKTYKAERLRSLSAKGEFDYSSLQPDWSTAIRDTLSGDIEVVAVPINLEDFCLPVSETLMKEDVERYKGGSLFPPFVSLSQTVGWQRMVRYCYSSTNERLLRRVWS